ncbi:Zinc finger RING-type, partial [Trinorchestia longiramus]
MGDWAITRRESSTNSRKWHVAISVVFTKRVAINLQESSITGVLDDLSLMISNADVEAFNADFSQEGMTRNVLMIDLIHYILTRIHSRMLLSQQKIRFNANVINRRFRLMYHFSVSMHDQYEMSRAALPAEKVSVSPDVSQKLYYIGLTIRKICEFIARTNGTEFDWDALTNSGSILEQNLSKANSMATKHLLVHPDIIHSHIFKEAPAFNSALDHLWYKLDKTNSSATLIEKNAGETTCPVCLEKDIIHEQSNFAILDACDHLLCCSCADRCFSELRNRCPMCRRPVKAWTCNSYFVKHQACCGPVAQLGKLVRNCAFVLFDVLTK